MNTNQNKPTTSEKQEKSKKRKQDNSGDVTSEKECAAASAPLALHYPHFFVAEPLEGGSLGGYSPFVIQKFLQCRVGNVRSAKKLQSGSVLIEVENSSQASSVSQLEMFVDQPIKVTPHRTLNSSRGVIRCRDLRDCDDDEVLTNLKSEGVTSVKHIFATRNGIKEPTNTFILTFNCPSVPSHLKVGYMRVAVEPYILNPLRCFGCQRYGHGKATCRRATVCARCGQEGTTTRIVRSLALR
jgi:hypothetical protein